MVVTALDRALERAAYAADMAVCEARHGGRRCGLPRQQDMLFARQRDENREADTRQWRDVILPKILHEAKQIAWQKAMDEKNHAVPQPAA